MLGLIGGRIDQATRLVDLYRAAGARAGHAPETLSLGITSHFLVGESAESARDAFFPTTSATSRRRRTADEGGMSIEPAWINWPGREGADGWQSARNCREGGSGVLCGAAGNSPATRISLNGKPGCSSRRRPCDATTRSPLRLLPKIGTTTITSSISGAAAALKSGPSPSAVPSGAEHHARVAPAAGSNTARVESSIPVARKVIDPWRRVGAWGLLVSALVLARHVVVPRFVVRRKAGCLAAGLDRSLDPAHRGPCCGAERHRCDDLPGPGHHASRGDFRLVFF